MLFRIQVKSNIPELAAALSLRNILSAKKFILAYPFGASERLLDTYLRTNFNKGLIECCLMVLYKLTRSTSTTNEVVYTLVDDYLDTMAQLITCGIGNTPGSRILVDSISHIYK